MVSFLYKQIQLLSSFSQHAEGALVAIMQPLTQVGHASKSKKIGIALALSWLFALCAQIIIPVSLTHVPVYLHPLPLFLAVLWFGPLGVGAYVLYLIQGACGLPFFTRGNAGLTYLFCAPTAGFLWGFLLALSIFATVQKSYVVMSKKRSLVRLALLIALGACYFLCGILGVARWVGYERCLGAGFYPFVIGDLVKLLIVWFYWNRRLS